MRKFISLIVAVVATLVGLSAVQSASAAELESPTAVVQFDDGMDAYVGWVETNETGETPNFWDVETVYKFAMRVPAITGNPADYVAGYLHFGDIDAGEPSVDILYWGNVVVTVVNDTVVSVNAR